MKIGSAVETAHRAGVLHRDIKPSNILLTAYGHPVLSDFGIAATLSEVASQEDGRHVDPVVGARGAAWMRPPASIASEVWSLAATVYSLLAGRSPFEIPGRVEHVGGPDVAHRPGQGPAHRTCRRAGEPGAAAAHGDVPQARKPRPASALEFVRELQAVETELGVPQTPVEVAMDDWALATVSDLEDRTRMRPATAATGAPPGPGGADGSAAAAITTTRRWALLLRESSPLVAALASRPGTAASRGMRGRRLGCSSAGPCWSSRSAPWPPIVLVNAGRQRHPAVTDIAAELDPRLRAVPWTDPGSERGRPVPDRHPRRAVEHPAAARHSPSMPSAGDRVCITVTVNRDGKTGRRAAKNASTFVSG